MNDASTYSVKALANWVLDYAESQGERPSNMALNKLVYFAYEHALITYGRKLTNAKIEAWQHGPVFREIYSAFKQFGSSAITDRATRYNTGTNDVERVLPQLAPDDEQLMMEALEPLIRLPAYILREISHDSSGAWSKVWNHGPSPNPGMRITDEMILHSSPTASKLQ
ncbi:MAG: type II toxin-antitoxin system antitoxin SocA domain-containing protein [Pseudomonadota bacterium]